MMEKVIFVVASPQNWPFVALLVLRALAHCVSSHCRVICGLVLNPYGTGVVVIYIWAAEDIYVYLKKSGGSVSEVECRERSCMLAQTQCMGDEVNDSLSLSTVLCRSRRSPPSAVHE